MVTNARVVVGCCLIEGRLQKAVESALDWHNIRGGCFQEGLGNGKKIENQMAGEAGTA